MSNEQGEKSEFQMSIEELDLVSGGIGWNLIKNIVGGMEPIGPAHTGSGGSAGSGGSTVGRNIQQNKVY